MYYQEPTLFVDCVGHATWLMNESAAGGCKFQGKFQEANAINKNKRKYPKSILETNVHKLQEAIQNRGMFGELDHPSDSIIHLANASHIITKLWWDGNVLMGEGEILNTPSGRVLRALTEAGVRWGISSRGVGQGQVDNDGILVIGESFKLITFDAVADPSTFSAYQRKKVREAAEEAGMDKLWHAIPQATNEAAKPAFNKDGLLSYLRCSLDESAKSAVNLIKG